MSLNLFSLALVLAVARGVHGVVQPDTRRTRLIFWSAVVLGCMVAFLSIIQPHVPLEPFRFAIWAASGIAGWYCPELFHRLMGLPGELFQRLGRIPLWKTALAFAGLVTIIVIVVEPDVMGTMAAIWVVPFGVWLLIMKVFIPLMTPKKKPAPRRNRRRRH